MVASICIGFTGKFTPMFVLFLYTLMGVPSMKNLYIYIHLLEKYKII